jgi:hypothetical protein
VDFYWQLRCHGDSARRVLFKIRALCREHDWDDDYIAGIARQMQFTGPVDSLAVTQLLKILAALKIHARRLAPAAAREREIDPENEPF